MPLEPPRWRLRELADVTRPRSSDNGSCQHQDSGKNLFSPGATKATKLTFLRYINRQLEELAFEGTVHRARIYECCGAEIPSRAVEARTKRGETTVLCPDCGRVWPIDDLAELVAASDASVDDQIRETVVERARQQRLVALSERARRAEFHVFLSHNTKDGPSVRLLAAHLRHQGLLAWVDEASIKPGEAFVPKLEEVIDGVPVAAIVVGANGMGPWQESEYHALMHRHIGGRNEQGRRRLRLVPVLLPEAPISAPELPAFLRGLQWVDFRTERGLEDADALARLVDAIVANHMTG